MNTTITPFTGTRRITETAAPHIPDVTVKVVGDQDADGRVTYSSICLAGEVLLSADEADAVAADLIAAGRELRALSDLDRRFSKSAQRARCRIRASLIRLSEEPGTRTPTHQAGAATPTHQAGAATATHQTGAATPTRHGFVDRDEHDGSGDSDEKRNPGDSTIGIVVSELASHR
jgi:hypothetical protein